MRNRRRHGEPTRRSSTRAASGTTTSPGRFQSGARFSCRKRDLLSRERARSILTDFVLDAVTPTKSAAFPDGVTPPERQYARAWLFYRPVDYPAPALSFFGCCAALDINPHLLRTLIREFPGRLQSELTEESKTIEELVDDDEYL